MVPYRLQIADCESRSALCIVSAIFTFFVETAELKKSCAYFFWSRVIFSCFDFRGCFSTDDLLQMFDLSAN